MDYALRAIVRVMPVMVILVSDRLFRFVLPDCRALKWSCPSRRLMTFPLFFTVNRFAIDCFVRTLDFTFLADFCVFAFGIKIQLGLPCTSVQDTCTGGHEYTL